MPAEQYITPSHFLSTFKIYLPKTSAAFAFIEPSERQEYEEALETVPELVEAETQVLGILREEGFDPRRTAAHIAKYWKCRKIIFQERWLLPLNQTGTGALSMEDIELLRTGFYVPFTRQGQGPLILLDESRLPRPTGNANFRLVFYFDYIYRNEPADITILHVVNSNYRPPPDMRRDMYQMVLASIRWNIKGFYVAQSYEEGKDELVDFLGFKTARTHEFRTQVPVGRLVANSNVGTLRMLEERGFHRNELPHCLGGDYSYSKFADWIRMRTSMEDIMAGAPIIINRLPVRIPQSNLMIGSGPLDAPIKRKGIRKTKKTPPALTNGDEATVTQQHQDKEALAELTRRRNALYSRRSNKRRELALLTLRDQEQILKNRNKALKNDNARLEYLLNMAQQVIKHTNYNFSNRIFPVEDTFAPNLAQSYIPYYANNVCNNFT